MARERDRVARKPPGEWPLRRSFPLAAAWLATLTLGCGETPVPPESVLLLIAADVGVDRIGAYETHPDPSTTPNLDALAARGVRFDRAWATPMCSPSRAAMLTGRLPSRNGVGAAIHLGRPDQARGLELDQTTLAQLLAGRGVETFAVGRWHMAGGPPPSLHGAKLSGNPRDTPRAHYDAGLEALDREIGRLLAAIDPDVLRHTTVIFVADNGTSQHGTRPPTHGQKRSLYEGGIRVPLIVAGPQVPPASQGRASESLVHVTDLFATIAELFGVQSEAEDSQSLLPYLANPATPSARSVLYTERFLPNGGPPDPERHFRAARDARYKLLVLPDQREFYDLETDPHERHDLIAEGTAPAAALARLERAVVTRGGTFDQGTGEAKERATPSAITR